MTDLHRRSVDLWGRCWRAHLKSAVLAARSEALITRTDKLLRDADAAVHRLRRAMAEVERANP
jgi:hypothetical protein